MTPCGTRVQRHGSPTICPNIEFTSVDDDGFTYIDYYYYNRCTPGSSTIAPVTDAGRVQRYCHCPWRARRATGNGDGFVLGVGPTPGAAVVYLPLAMR